MTANASTAVIRQWARGQGLIVGDRGRLSPEVLDAYAIAHSQPQQTSTTAATATAPRKPETAIRVRVRPLPGATGNMRTITARAA